ncbi:hypothetical protein KZ359_09595, partial [Glaesserella parasuis]|nr:hypothetical protein [Glaesserella parasuis]
INFYLHFQGVQMSPLHCKKKKKKQHLHKIKNKIDAGSILEVVSKSAAPLPEITASCGATKEAC